MIKAFQFVLPRRDTGNFAQERRGCSHSGRQVGSEELWGRDESTRQAAVASQGMANKGSEDSITQGSPGVNPGLGMPHTGVRSSACQNRKPASRAA